MLSMSLWITLLLLLLGYALWSRRKAYRLMMKIGGPKGYPIFGDLLRIISKTAVLTMVGDEIKTWGSLFLCWFGPLPILIVSDPKYIQEIITSPNAMGKAHFIYAVFRQIVANGLVSINDPKWSKHRKIFNSAFSNNIILSFLPLFNDHSNDLVREMDAVVGKGEQNLAPIIKNFNLRIATHSNVDYDLRKDEAYRNNSLLKSYLYIIQTGIDFIIRPWLNNKPLRVLFGREKLLKESNVIIKNIIKKSIVERKQKVETSEAEHKKSKFVDLALDQYKNGTFNYQTLEDECHMIVTAAFETTSVTFLHTLILLAMHPEHQEKVYAEIESLFPNRGNFEVSYEEVHKLEYLDKAINESMRVLPSFPLIGRQVTQDLTLSNGAVLPKGMQVLVSIYHMHRSKEIWGPDAEQFNPEHCRVENLQQKHPYAFIPFSKGKRNCIGGKYAMISLKVSLAKVLRNFRFSTSARLEDLVIVNNFALSFRNVPQMTVERRS